MAEKINVDMANIVGWTKENQLWLNAEKTVFLVLGANQSTYDYENFTICINGVSVYASQQMKCLGIIIDNKLNWKCHINNLAKKCYTRIRTLYSIKHYLSPDQLKLFGQSLVLSLLYYMSAVWGQSSQCVLKISEKILRSLSRLVLNKRKYDPVAADITKDLKWLLS